MAGGRYTQFSEEKEDKPSKSIANDDELKKTIARVTEKLKDINGLVDDPISFETYYDKVERKLTKIEKEAKLIIEYHHEGHNLSTSLITDLKKKLETTRGLIDDISFAGLRVDEETAFSGQERYKARLSKLESDFTACAPGKDTGKDIGKGEKGLTRPRR